MAHLIKILSIDGGGIRGIIPAMILAEIEKRTKKPIAEIFHLIAGTSTGGILALALTKPDPSGRPQYTAEELAAFYESNGEKIFYRSFGHAIRTAWNLIDEKYPSESFERILYDYFGEARLKDSLTDIVITGYEIERRMPWFFKSREAKIDRTMDFSLVEVARSTSAAPTYFEPFRIGMSGSSDYYALIDGGVIANNPAMCAFAEAKNIYRDETDVLLVSLGTGDLTRPLPYEEAKDWGLAGWAKPLFNIFLDGLSSTVHYQLKRMLPLTQEGIRRYYRFQVRLDKENEELDDGSHKNVRNLKLLAEAFIRDRDQILDILCRQLVQEEIPPIL